MSYIIVGLGNPGNEYEETRHNVGRMMLFMVQKQHGFAEWSTNKKTKSLESNGFFKKEKAVLVMPETFMNNSGKAVVFYAKSKKAIEKVIVVYDDLDLPLGKFKISFGRGSGGHRGLDSIIKHLKTKDFVRVRVGISPTTPSQKLKKPSGEKAVLDFILGRFKKNEIDILKKESKKIVEAIESICVSGREKAMGEFN